MNSRRILTISLILVLLGFGIGLAKEVKDGTAQIQNAPMENWVGLSCPDENSSSKVKQELVKNAALAEKWFIDMIEKGPSQEQLASVQEDFRHLYKARKSFLTDDNRKIGIEKNGETVQWSPNTDISEEEYVKRKTKAFKKQLTFRCFQGLALINTPGSNKYLDQKANDKNYSLRKFVLEARELR